MRISDWSSDVCSSDLGLAVAGDLRRDADAEVAGEALGHLDLDFELVEVHHAQHRAVGDHAGALRHVHLADLAIERRADGQRVHLALLFGHDGLLAIRSEEHTSELQSLMRISYAVFCLKKKKIT